MGMGLECLHFGPANDWFNIRSWASTISFLIQFRCTIVSVKIGEKRWILLAVTEIKFLRYLKKLR